jgi:hypothetical protein
MAGGCDGADFALFHVKLTEEAQARNWTAVTGGFDTLPAVNGTHRDAGYGLRCHQAVRELHGVIEHVFVKHDEQYEGDCDVYIIFGETMVVGVFTKPVQVKRHQERGLAARRGNG